MNCLLVNQFATPGLGSLMGRRYVEGALQLALAVGGFVLVIWAYIQWFWGMFRNVGGADSITWPFPAYGKVGAIMFAASWCLAWVTSISLLRAARKTQQDEMQSKLPPKILPPKIKRD